jgi:uncharacterized protein YbjT (DUF2867 family)
VFGGSGFLGRQIVKRLAGDGTPSSSISSGGFAAEAAAIIGTTV